MINLITIFNFLSNGVLVLLKRLSTLTYVLHEVSETVIEKFKNNNF